MKTRVIDMDIMSELASAIVEDRFNKRWELHSFEDENGDLRYTEEAQDEFNEVLDIIDDVLNGGN